MQTLYSISIYLYRIAISLVALFGNKKASLWIEGRKNWQTNLKNQISGIKNPIWFHVASLGEFEQARPLIELLKEKDPSQFILLSFFSPSGYEIRKDYKHANYICYLPLDSKSNAKQLVKMIKPQLVIFVKYEFWINLLNELRKREIKSILVSGIFRPSQHFFKFYGSFFRKGLKAFNHLFVQNQTSKSLLESIAIDNVSIVGDTRFDQVIEITKQNFDDARINSFCNGKKQLVFGSSWSRENEFALKLEQENLACKMIIAPHEINSEKLKLLKTQFQTNTILWSETKEGDDLSDYSVLIIDQIGMLSRLYRYAKIAIIGGGFGSGIHNTLEAAAYGIPVIFGPNYKKFQEAHDLIECAAAFSINNFEEFNTLLTNLLSLEDKYTLSSNASKNYVMQQVGASSKILNYILELKK